MVNQYVLLWSLGFLLVYVAAQLTVSRLPYFQTFSPIKKSVMVKVIALLVFVAAYGITQLFI